MEPHGRKAHDAEQAIIAKRTLMESYRAARSEAKSAGQEAPTFEQFMAARAPKPAVVVVPPAPIVVVEAEGATSEVNIVAVEVESNESDAVSEPDLTPSE